MSPMFGRVVNGVVVLAEGQTLPEGTPVRVEPIEGAAPGTAGDLADQLLKWAGKGVDLPADLARRHDHYLHGQE